MDKEKLKWRWVIVASLGFILFVSFVLPWFSAYSTKMIGDLDSPDSSFFYTAKELYAMAESYGENGRITYILLRWSFDVVWPVVYTTFLVLWTMKLASYIKECYWVEFLYLLPVIAMVLDFIENIGATIVMVRYPSLSGVIAVLTPMATMFKWVTISASFGLIIILVLILAYQKLRKPS